MTNKYNDVTSKSGDLLTYLGMVVDRNTTTNQVTISQPAYIEKMLILAEMSECKGIDTPMAIEQTVNIFCDLLNQQDQIYVLALN